MCRRLILLLFAPQFSFQVFDHPISRAFQNRFSTQYRCYSVSMLAGPNDRSDVEKGGKSKGPEIVHMFTMYWEMCLFKGPLTTHDGMIYIGLN